MSRRAKIAAATLCALSLGAAVRAQPLVIEHATVLPMTEPGAELTDTTLIIADGMITAIGPDGTISIPPDAERLDASGKFLVPAFTDMHVHLDADLPADLPFSAEETLLPYFATGVLRVVDLGSSRATVALSNLVSDTRLPAPDILTARMIDGMPPIRMWVAVPLADPAQADDLVRAIKSEGYDFIKVYSRLDIASFRALASAAQLHGIRVIGHLPARGTSTIEEAIAGLSLVAHAEEFGFRSTEFSDAEITRYVKLALTHGTALISTLYLDEQILVQMQNPDALAATPGIELVNPSRLPEWFDDNPYAARATPDRVERITRLIAFNRRLVRAFVDAGIPVMAGTDTGVPGLAPGFALHQEFLALQRAGFTPDEILRAATSTPGAWLGDPERLGIIAVGQRADLLLLDADPRGDIANTLRIEAVIRAGNLTSRDQLDQLLADLARRYGEVHRTYSQHASDLLDARSD